MEKQSKCTTAQLESLAKARAAAAQKKQASKPADLAELIELVRSVKNDMAMLMKEERAAISQLKAELETVKKALPKKADLSFLSKF